MVEKEFTFVEESELVGRKVELYFTDFEDTQTGVIHSISNHGILIKTEEEGNYELYPWWQIKCVVHEVKKDIGQKIEPKVTPEVAMRKLDDKWEPEIIESPKTIVIDNLPEGYGWEWVDEDDGELLVEDDEDEESLRIHLEDKIEVLLSKDIVLAKKLAKALNIKSIVKDYSE